MDIDLINDLRRDDDNDASDENDEKHKRDDSENEETKTTDVEAVMKKANEVAKKKVTRRPRPKLDINRLTGARGLDELTNLFKDEKFNGKGYEFADLDTLMHKFEYWAHRLVPHMAFDDFIEKAEKLGNKRAIKHAIQRLRDKLNIQNNLDENEQLGDRLFDILPSINPEHDDGTSNKNTQDKNNVEKSINNNDIPDDDELNELFE